tara:strand:+ start:1484 stop:2116 length:633 start_codon:yes stop_codon:yes gene_type:complete
MAKHQMNVSEFKSNFDGGSRSNRFLISGNLPNDGAGTPINSIVVKAGSMPAVTLGILRVPFRGRVVKIPGDRTYEEWTFTVMDGFDERSEWRNAFVEWNANFNMHESNTPKNPGSGIDLDDENLFKTWNVTQLGLDGSAKRQISLHKCWPVVVSELSLSYDNSDTISEYTVTFAYDWLSGDGTHSSVEESEIEGPITTPEPDPNPIWMAT